MWSIGETDDVVRLHTICIAIYSHQPVLAICNVTGFRGGALTIKVRLETDMPLYAKQRDWDFPRSTSGLKVASHSVQPPLVTQSTA